MDDRIPTVLPILIAALVTLAIASLLIRTRLLASRSGWVELASAYRGPYRFTRITTIAISNGGPFVVYRGIADVSATEYGLHLALLSPFAAGHPPILVPWERLALTQIDGKQATMQVAATTFVVRVHASKVLTQVRYWLDELEPPPDDLLP